MPTGTNQGVTTSFPPSVCKTGNALNCFRKFKMVSFLRFPAFCRPLFPLLTFTFVLRKTPFVSRADLHAAVCERLNEKIKTRRESARLPSAGSHAHAAAERGANANSPKHDAASSASASHPPGSHDAPHAEEKTVGVQGHSNEQAQQHAPLAHGRGELGSGLLQLDREQVMKDNRVLRSQHRLWEKRSQRMLVSLRKTHAHSLGERKKGEGSTDSSGMSASNASNVS